MEIAYRAHTEACTFLLDASGICRSVLAASANGGKREGRAVRIPATAERCIGAQYIACIDVREAGGMIAKPRPGAHMLFGVVGKDGRIAIVRTGAVTRFEDLGAPIVGDSGVRERPAAPDYGDDEEATTPFASPTVPFKRELLAPIMRSSGVDRPARRADAPSSIPPAVPDRLSGVAPVARPVRVTIPPPPPLPTPRASWTPAPPSSAPTLPRPRRPSLARASEASWEVDTQPRKRAAR